MAYDRSEFNWIGLNLHWGHRKTPVLQLVADETCQHLYRVLYPNGWTSSSANISRAKDAAYNHARALLTQKGRQSRREPVHSGESPRAGVWEPV